MNLVNEHTDDRPMRPVEKKKQKRVKTEKFNVNDYIYGLWISVEDSYQEQFAEFILDEWRWAQRRRIRGSGIARLEAWLRQGFDDTLYARRILRKTKQR